MMKDWFWSSMSGGRCFSRNLTLPDLHIQQLSIVFQMSWSLSLTISGQCCFSHICAFYNKVIMRGFSTCTQHCSPWVEPHANKWPRISGPPAFVFINNCYLSKVWWARNWLEAWGLNLLNDEENILVVYSWNEQKTSLILVSLVTLSFNSAVSSSQ